MIDPDIYPFLLRWGLSTGYEVNVNDDHTLLYALTCKDPIRVRELKVESKGTGLSHLSQSEAVDLINKLKPYVGNASLSYDPDYEPPIKLHEDFATEVFEPAVSGSGNVVLWEQWGVYHKIKRVTTQPTGKPCLLFINARMCRSEVCEIIRELEFDAVMKPYIVGFNILQKRGLTYIIWEGDEIREYDDAESLLGREKVRHLMADWRIYAEVTETAKKSEFLPENYVRCEGWLWLRVYHPNKEGAMGADHWELGFYENLGDLKNALLYIIEDDMYAVPGIYACAYHDPLPEDEKPPIPITDAKDPEDRRHDSDLELWQLMYRVMKPSERKGYGGQCKEVALGYGQDMPTEQALDQLTAIVKDHVTLPPFSIILYRMEKLHEVK